MGQSVGGCELRINKNGTVDGVTVGPDPSDWMSPIQHFTNLDEEQVAAVLEDRLVEIDPPIDVSVLPYMS